MVEAMLAFLWTASICSALAMLLSIAAKWHALMPGTIFTMVLIGGAPLLLMYTVMP